jgi:hypothetical protein
MQDWLTMALFALGLGLIVSAIFKRRGRLRRVVPAGEMRPEYAAMGKIVRPLVLSFLAILALKVSVFYFLFGGQRFLTPSQYAGVMFVLLAYAGWLVAATTRRRIAAPAPVEAPVEAGIRSAA